MKISRRIRYYFIRLFRIKSNPHHVALGLTIGLIPSWFPTFGLDVLISVSLAKLVNANKISALIGGIIGTPIWPLLFFLNYKVGSLIFDRNSNINDPNEVEYITTTFHTLDIEGSHSPGFLFLTGAVINMLVVSILIYVISYFLFKIYRVSILKRIRSNVVSGEL